jgi:outer membrane lipoprotein-sorting protein
MSMRSILRHSILLCALFASSASAQEPPTLDSLLARFAAMPGLEARFTEEKRIALLAMPVRSEGQLFFAPPGRLLRRVERPEPSVALIDGDQLRMRQGDRTETISMSNNAVLRGFIDSFRAVLAGDRAALERYYRAELVPLPDRADGWELRLRPRNRDLARFLRQIRMRGDGVTLREMWMTEVNGDETHTVFADVNTARRFSRSEAGRIFRISP